MQSDCAYQHMEMRQATLTCSSHQCSEVVRYNLNNVECTKTLLHSAISKLWAR